MKMDHTAKESGKDKWEEFEVLSLKFENVHKLHSFQGLVFILICKTSNSKPQTPNFSLGLQPLKPRRREPDPNFVALTFNFVLKSSLCL